MAVYYISQLVNGLCQGAVFALLAVGFSTINGVVGMVSFSYGDVMMVSAYAAFYVYSGITANFVVSAAAAGFVLGFCVYKICYERFLNAPPFIMMICTLGFSTLISNLAQLVFGRQAKPFLNVVPNTSLPIGPVSVRMTQILIMGTALVFAILLTLLVKKTKLGVALRAVSQNKQAAYLMGINVKRTIMLGSCIGYSMAGACGILLAVYYQSVNTAMGSSVTLKAFASSVLGGLTDVRLSALGGVCIGVIENMGIAVSSSSLRDLFAFVFLIIVLLIRPKGFGRQGGGGL
jgi:branched-chain amino acid transport system permease protein